MLLSACVGYVAHPPADIPNGKQTYKDESIILAATTCYHPAMSWKSSTTRPSNCRMTTPFGDWRQIRIEFFDAPQFDRTLDVRPDGRVTVPFFGDLDAFGLTPTELAKRIDQASGNCSAIRDRPSP